MKHKIVIKPKTVNVSIEKLEDIKKFASDNGFTMEVTHMPKKLWK
jgi:hypothetical protein